MPHPPTLDTSIDISGNPKHPLLVKEVKYAFTLPDYPETHQDGIAYVVDIRGMPLEERQSHTTIVMYSEYILNALLIYLKVQYSTALKYPKTDSKPWFLDNAPCDRSVLRCTGVKVCEYLASDLRNIQHISITEFNWDAIKAICKRYSIPSLNQETMG